MNIKPAAQPSRKNGADAAAARPHFWRWIMQSVFGVRDDDYSVREAIEELIEDSAEPESTVETEERTLLANILRIRERTVNDVMVPRADIVAIDAKASLEDLVELINRESHSRVPVYRESLDGAIGMIHIKDVLAAREAGRSPELSSILRDVLFVAPSMQVLELLLEMRVKRSHMALVVDEFGGVDGLVTIEDLVEEIVGEIEDEHDQDVELEMVQRRDGSFDADARIALDVFEEKIGSVLSDEEREEIDTLGGLVFMLAGRVPVRGELVTHASGVEIEVLETDPRRIKRLRVIPPADVGDAPADPASGV